MECNKVIIAGPCSIESEQIVIDTASALQEITHPMDVRFFFKSSFLKANRTHKDSFRGPGLNQGLKILNRVSEEVNVLTTTDIHETFQAKPVSEVVDLIQIPALLSRQTFLLEAAAETGAAVNIKKGQFMPPSAMKQAVEKVTSKSDAEVFVTERGTTFGHGDLVVDFRGVVEMQGFTPVIFDATHSVQKPADGTDTSGGDWRYTIHLARAAAAMGVDGIFFETHPSCQDALCDGDIMWPLDRAKELIEAVSEAWRLNGS